MGIGKFLGGLLGGAGAAVDPVQAAGDVVSSAEKIISLFKLDPNVKAQLQAQLTQENVDMDKASLAAQVAQMQAQADIDKQEAGSTNWFVAGWRPFVGWTLGLALTYDLLLQPFAIFLLAVFHWEVGKTPLPTLDSTAVTGMLIPLLGLGTLRTIEKVNDAATNH
jgi:hypothetical protein